MNCGASSSRRRAPSAEAYDAFMGLTAADISALGKLGREIRRLRASRIGALRHCQRISQLRLAQHAGLGHSTIANLERAYRRPRLSTLLAIAEAVCELRPAVGSVREVFARLTQLADGLVAPESTTAPDRAPEEARSEEVRRAQPCSTAPPARSRTVRSVTARRGQRGGRGMGES